MLGGDFDHIVSELDDVARAHVVPAAMREGGVEHRLVLKEGLRLAQVEDGSSEVPQRRDYALALLHRPAIAADDARHELAVELAGHERERRSAPMDHDRHQLIGSLGDPLAIEAKQIRRLLHWPEDRARKHGWTERIEAKLELGH